MTVENTATCRRDLADQLTAEQVAMLASDEFDGFTPACLLFNARDLTTWNAGVPPARREPSTAAAAR